MLSRYRLWFDKLHRAFDWRKREISKAITLENSDRLGMLNEQFKNLDRLGVLNEQLQNSDRLSVLSEQFKNSNRLSALSEQF